MDIKKIAVDAIKGRITDYSTAQSSEAIRNAMIEMNDDSMILNLKRFYRGSELFALTEELIPVMINEGIKNDNILMSYIDYRNIADGDLNSFRTKSKQILYVANAAEGVQAVRRQRLSDGQSIEVPTKAKVIRVYDEISRFMSGRIDLSEFTNAVAVNMKRSINEDCVAAINGITASTAGLSTDYIKSGSFTEATLVSLVDDVEAESDSYAKIIGSRSALRKITTATVADEARSDMYNFGYYSKFNGTPMFAIKGAHNASGASILNASKAFVIAGDDKFVKCVNEGAGLLQMSEASSRADLTQELVYVQNVGVGVICANPVGVYTIS